MDKKLKVLIPLLVLGVAGYFGFIHLRFFLYTMKVREDVDRLGRFPTIATIEGLKDVLKDTAVKSHIPLETWSASTKIEGRNAGPLRFYYLVVTVKDAARSFVYGEHRIESDKDVLTDAGIDDLKQHDIAVEK